MAVNHPDIVLGFEDDVWWSREAQPQMHAWSADKPVRLVEKAVPAKDPAGKAVACYGLYVPTAHHMLLRFVQGRPVSAVTCAFLAWLAAYFAAQGKQALLRIWDNASWHGSQAVQEWIKAHNRTAKHEGGCRLIVCRLPSKSPWLNPIEPKWLHGKRAVVEPARVLSMAELMQPLPRGPAGLPEYGASRWFPGNTGSIRGIICFGPDWTPHFLGLQDSFLYDQTTEASLKRALIRMALS